MLQARNVDRWVTCPWAGYSEKMRPKDPKKRTEYDIAHETVCNGSDYTTDATDEMKTVSDEINEWISKDTSRNNATQLKFYKKPTTYRGVECDPLCSYFHKSNNCNVWTIVVFDYGHRFVNHYESKRAILAALSIVPEGEPKESIYRLVIAQPRCYQVDSFRMFMRTGLELQSIINEINNAIDSIDESNKLAHAGEHCRGCLRMLGCDANVRCSENAIEVSQDCYPNFDTRTIDRQYDVLTYAKQVIEDRLKAIEGEVEAKGHPGFRTVSTRGTVNWQDEDKAVSLAQMYGVNICKGQKLMTPNQAVKAGLPEDVKEQITVRKTKTKIERITAQMIKEALNP